MSDSARNELRCPVCRASLGIAETANLESAIECPGCGQLYYPENSDETGRNEALEKYLDERIKTRLPPPKPKRSAPLPGGQSIEEDVLQGWSKWQHAAPPPKIPELKGSVKRPEEKAVIPPILSESDPLEQAGDIEQSTHSNLPTQREIDAERRRRVEMLQRQWDGVADEEHQSRPPIDTKKDPTFEHDLASTLEREAKPEDPVMKRLDPKAAEDLRWDDQKEERQLADRTGRAGDRPQRLRAVCFALVGVAILVAVGVMIHSFDSDEVPPVVELASGGDTAYSSPDYYNPADHYEVIMNQLVGYLTAESPEQMLEYVRDRERVAPLVKKYYDRHPYQFRLLRDRPSADSLIYVEGFVVVPCSLTSGENLLVPMEVKPGLKVDWEATVGYSDRSWDELMTKKPTSPTLVRVFVLVDDYYNWGFTRQKYLSIRMSDPSGDYTLYGYIPRSSTLMNKFQQLFPKAFSSNPAVQLAALDVKFPDFEADDNQVEITSIGAKGWVYRRDVTTSEIELPLFANDAVIDGDDAILTKDLRIANWRSRSTALEWSVTIERPVHVWVSAILANGGSRGKRVSLSVDQQEQNKIVHLIPFTGGWDEFETVVLGRLDFPQSGTFSVRVEPVEDLKASEASLATIDRLIFAGGTDLIGTVVNDQTFDPVMESRASVAVPDHGIEFNTLTDAERKNGWRMLFDGKEPKGWLGYRMLQFPEGWVARNGELALEKPGAGSLVTVEEFGNFEFKLEWKLDENASSGVFFRVVDTKATPEETGLEIQFTQNPLEAVDPLQSNGAVNHLFPPQPFPPGKDGWNELHVRFIDEQLQYWINGRKMGVEGTNDIIEPVKIGSSVWKSQLERSRVGRFQRFVKAAKGHICLDDAGTPVRFRNIKVRER